MPTPIPAQLKPLFKQAKELLSDQQNYIEARRVLASIPSAEQYTQFHTAMSRIATLEGDAELAYAHVERALALTPDDVLILARLGKMSLAKDDKQKAMSFAERAFAVGPSSKKEISILATLFSQLDQPSKTQSLLEAGIEKSPNDPKLRRMMALCLLDLGHLKAAEAELDACLRIAPTNHAATVMLGEIYLKQGLHTQAIKLLRSADNDNCPPKLLGRVNLNVAECQVALGLLQDSKTELMKIENMSGCRYNLVWARIQMAEGNYELCLNSLRAALNSIPHEDQSAVDALVERCTSTSSQEEACRSLISEVDLLLLQNRKNKRMPGDKSRPQNDIDDFDLS